MDQIIEKKIDGLEKWAARLQREIWIWKNVHTMQKNSPSKPTLPKKIVQTDIFELMVNEV